MGVIRPDDAFLAFLGRVYDDYGTLVIFDEVMTGFRVAPGGAQQLFNFRPDLTCLDKVVGGGLPVGVYGGRADVMRHISLGPVYQAGTLSGNPLATAAGLKTIEVLRREGTFEAAERAATQLADGLAAMLTELGVEGSVERSGTMLTLFFGPKSQRTLMRSKSATTRSSVVFTAPCSMVAFICRQVAMKRGLYQPPTPRQKFSPP